jgi:hypothetical protein
MSSSGENHRMIIPRFTVRWLLALMAFCAVFAFIVSLAVSGNVWAIALSVALASIVLTFVLHAAGFCCAWGMSTLWRMMTRRTVAASPFATHTSPPQVLRPEEPD